MNLRARCQQYGWLSAILLLLMAIKQTVSSETRVVCYYTNWSVYRPGTAKFSPQNINPYLCTHLIYAFGGFTKENSLKPFDKYQDIEKGGYAKFTGLKTYNKNLKTMLAIGGWNEGSSRFSPMVASPDRRKELVKNTVKFLRQNHFDGLDLDWEYPSFRDGGKARDRENYAQLVQELREEFDRESEKTGRPRLLLTMAVPAGIEYINKGYDVPKLTKYLDWMNILSYDYHSAFEPAVNHHSPLYPLEEENEYNFDADLNIDHTIKHYLKMGADPNKLVLGIPTYGRSYTLFNPDANEIGAPADGPGDMGDATRENGYLAFYEICENLKENDWKIVQPNPTAMGPYAYKGNQWVSYDDELIVRKKSEYVVENNLGGIMFWSIDNDDFRGHCFNKPYPLIEAAKEALIAAATGKTENNLVSTSSKSRKPIVNPRSRTRYTSNSAAKKEESATTARVQNSGGRQGGNEISNSSGSRKRIRSGSRTKDKEEEPIVEKEARPQRRIKPRGSGRRRKTTTTAAPTTTTTTSSSILSQTTPSWKTPEPPTTPDPGGDFKCEEDGFFPHPRDCKKYFWCLSGPADLGIVAHQFTCPAGLYFNKAADSCDYTQNVFCKKNAKTTTTAATTSATSTTTTTQAPSTTTRRVPARITAATSRTTFLYTSTTTTTPEPEYYDDEYEYEDEDLEDAPRRGEPDSEEDPRVIKELIDLIKKVGGVEELEKYLNLQEDGTMAVTHSAGSTTPATISRSLYERVLSRATVGKTTGGTTSGATTKQNRNSLTYAAINRNSRPGPQNAGIEKNDEDDSSKRERPKYTTITRQRASTEKAIDTDAEEEEDDIEDNEEEVKSTRSRQFATKKSNQPEYVTIRRSRPTTAISEVEEDIPTRSSLRGRQRGVPGEEEEVSTGTQSPEYVTIRRSRPTTEETTTSKYTTIQRRRPATESPEETESTIDSDPTKRRSTTITSEDTATTTVESEPSTFLSNQEKLDDISGTINSIVDDEKEVASTSTTVTTEGTTDSKSTIENSTTETSTVSQSTSDTAQSTTVLQNTKTNQVDSQTVTQESSSEKTSPQLFRPRPFATRTRGTTTSKPTTEVTESSIKVSEQSGIKPSAPSRNFGGLNRKFQSGNRFTVRGQNTIVGSNSNSESSSQDDKTSSNNSLKVQVVTEDPEGDEQRKETDEEYRQRIRNRGRSKFTLPTSTVEPTRRRRPNHETVTQEYEYDYEELHRSYRPSVLADLSSLTSVDIAFQRGNNRKHIRRRPEISTTTTTTTEEPEPSLKTGPRTLPLARKLISESQFGKNTRRIIPAATTKADTRTTTTTESSKESIQITRNPLLLKPRLSYSSLIRTTTTGQPEKTTESTKTTTEESEQEATTSSPETEKTQITKLTDSTESQSVNEYKSLAPDKETSTDFQESNNNDNNLLASSITTTEEVVEDSEITTNENESKTTETNNTTAKQSFGLNRKLVRVPILQKPTITETTTPELANPINRTRKVIIANRRFRPTTVGPLGEGSSNTTQEATLTRQRSTFLTRNNQRPTITRLRPVKNQDDETETNITSESNRGYVKRIRPVNLRDKSEDEEKIKLSETNISESIGTIRNLPEDDINTNRKRKIVRRIRPSKDTIFSETKNEDDFQGSKRLRITGKNASKDEDIIEEDSIIRIRGKANSVGRTDNVEEGIIKRIRPFLTKSESTDIVRSENEDNQGEVDAETEKNDETTTNNIRKGKELSATDETEISTDEVEKQMNSETETVSESTTVVEDENKTKEIKPTVSSLYKPILNTRKVKFLDTVTTTESPSTVRNRNVIRKFRPGLTTESSRNVVLENIRNGNRTKKIIRRLRPASTTSTTTTESIEVSSTTTESLLLINTEEESLDITTILPEIETESNDVTTVESITTIVTENTDEPEEPTTTTTTTPRPTRPSLIGRSRPTYRPRGRQQLEIRSTTPGSISPIPFRRRLNKNTSPKPENEEEKEETEDGIIDDKLKKLYNKKLKYTPIVRSTTERLKALEEEEKEKLEEKARLEEEAKLENTENLDEIPTSSTTTKTQEENETDVTTVSELATEQETIMTTMENIAETTIVEDVITTITENKKQFEATTEAISTTESEVKTTVASTTESEVKTTIASTTESEVKATVASTTSTEASSTKVITENNPETVTESEIITTEMIGNTETEIPTTEMYTETHIQEITSENVTSVESTTEDNISTVSTTIAASLETTSAASTSENNKNLESDKAYKPIRYKPSDRPKLRIKLNRTDTTDAENEREANEQRNGKFTPSRTLAQRNRSRLAYRKETSTEKSDDKDDTRGFVPTGRKLERPKFGGNQIKTETSSEPAVETKSERSHYPTLKPVINFNINQNDDGYFEEEEPETVDEEYDEITDKEEPEEPRQIENPVIKYLQTIRNNQEIINVNTGELPDDNEPVFEEETPEEVDEEYSDAADDNIEDPENKQNENVPKFNTPIVNRPVTGARPIQNQPNVPVRAPNRPQYTPKRPAVNRPLPGPIANKPVSNEPNRPSNVPVAGNIPVAPRPAPTAPGNNRNYPRRFNKPVNPTISTTTPESLAGINIEAVNQRNKNLFTKNRKANIPHPGPAVVSSTTSASELEYTPSEIAVTTELQLNISQVTEETILPEPTTEQLSTLHHVFAEPDIPETTSSYMDVTSPSIETTTKYNFTAAQIEAARNLERLIEVNRIVEVSFKEDKVKNSAGVVETRVKLEREPTLTRIGAINRVTVIKVVDGNNETDATFPSNHALTLNEIITGKKLDIDSNIDVYAQLHAPDINLTKFNILNNTLEIIKHEKSSTTTSPTTTTEMIQETTPTTTTETIQETTLAVKIPEGEVQVVNGPKIDPTIATTPKEEKKFEIISKSNVIDYSHRDLDPIQLIAQARPDPNAAKQGRKLEIESVSNVANNNRPVFNEATTLPLEALFQTDSPDFNQLKLEGSTDLPITSTLKDNDNDVNDDQDLLESRHHNGRVRIRILGEDTNNFETLEKDNTPKFAPIRILKDDEFLRPEIVTLKADVVEIKAKPDADIIRIAPIEVSLSNQDVKLPLVRVESSSSSKTSAGTQNSVPLKRELSSGYFNPTIIFGETANTRK